MSHVILSVVDVNVSLGVCLGGGFAKKREADRRIISPKSVFGGEQEDTL